jgi:hypothetical protein
METKYYLPISSKCLAHYFGSACIMPSKYFQNKPADLQNKYEDFLLLTNNVGTNETDCCLELVLIGNELNELIDIKEGFYLYQKPLPISRVKKVLFSDKQQMEQTIANITISTAFVPDKLIQKISKFDSAETIRLEIPNNTKLKDWSVEIKKYNSFLGGFALMRLAGEEYMNYSENYFSTLSFFNEVFKNELSVAGRNIDNRFFDAFIGESSFKKLYPIINKNVDENDLNEIAKEERQTIVKDKITRIIDLNNLEKATYIIAVLNTFGVGDEAKKKKIDGLILSNFKSEIKPDKSEVVALCYGLNKGYSSFPNKYKSGNKEKIVKFQLNSQVDYYTIESLFQFVFNNTKVEGLPYLDNWCPKFIEKQFSKNKSDYQVMDVLVVGKKKPKVFSQEYLANLLVRFFQKETETYFRDFVEKIRTTIYNDTKEEFQDEISFKEDEIIKLRKEQERVSKLESELNRLKIENSSLKNQREENDTYKTSKTVNKITVVEEPIQKFLTAPSEKLEIAQEIFKYQAMTVKILEKKAIERGISTKGLKKEEIIIQLISTKSNSLFENQ